MQRFQLAVYPDDMDTCENIDRHPDTNAHQAALDVFEHLDTFNLHAIGAEDADENDSCQVPFLRFTRSACECYSKWRKNLQNRFRSGMEAPALISHLMKYKSIIPSLALIDHLVNGGTGPVTMESLNRAFKWGDYLETHARRIYNQHTEPTHPYL